MPDVLALVGPTGVQLLVFFQHCSYFLLSSPHRCFISVFVWFLCSRRCSTDELETLHADWTNVLCIPRQDEGCGHVKSPPPPSLQVRFSLTVPRRCFCCGLLFLSLYVFACMSCWFFLSLIAIWPLVWDRNGPFGILFVVFWFWCRCFKCVLLSLWCFERKQVSICMYYTIFFRF